MTEEFNDDGVYTDNEELVQETEHDDHEEVLEENQDDENHESEPAKKKTGYVEFDTPEQKARVAQLTREKHENERKYKAAMQKLSSYESAQAQPPKEVSTPTADPVTDPEEFIKQQRAREQYIAEHTRFEDGQRAHKEAQKQIEAQRSQELAKIYVDNAAKLKINPKVLEQAGKVCESFGIHDNKELTEYLLKDPKGAAIVVHLGANEDELSLISSMSTADAVDFIALQIKPRLAAKQTSKAPPPATKVNGSRGKSQSQSGWEIS